MNITHHFNSILAATFFGLILTSTGSASGQRLPEGTQIDRDIVYEKVSERELPLDLYRPKSEEPTPLVLWVMVEHGEADRNAGQVLRWNCWNEAMQWHPSSIA